MATVRSWGAGEPDRMPDTLARFDVPSGRLEENA